ncbi:LPS export ABC transporter permease LptG [Thalassotalea sp. LPB0316]|uniref:LPS export ABC transporter permease LptG n=1 Tax=Thalassotalea sp. LPB0316 TaxID=2769490 RepID=UPI0018665E47|nr:LPS export ABC transporter permease LptG [Thalassotalea sp. LPB0316]QOL27193.1 LPS export ABC transporter permease LptG [Thalassotalea sp. LPB0316]
MMKILDWYIGRVIASTTLMTLTVFVSISGIIKFVEQIRAVGRGNYDLSHAALYVLYSTPRDIEIFFPMSALIGGLIGIGMLASHSELIVMQAAGLSRLDIIKSVMKAAAILVLLSMAVGEWLAPKGEAAAREIRAQAISGGSLISSKTGIWAKDGDYFVHISEVENTGTLKQIQIYRFDDNLKLESWSAANKATYQQDSWLLHDVKNTKIYDMSYTTEIAETQIWQSSLTPEKLGVVIVNPEALSIQGLLEYLEYLKNNEQDPSRYELALWRKIIQPFTVGVMLLLALSFIFGPLRSMSMGARIVMGVATGIVFYLVNQVAGSISLVYQLPPILGAILPSIIFVGAATFYMNKRA